MSKLSIVVFFLLILFFKQGHAQNFDPMDVLNKKNQYDKSKAKEEKKSEKEMKKQNDDFADKKKYKKEVRKGKHRSAKRPKNETMIIEEDKNILMA